MTKKISAVVLIFILLTSAASCDKNKPGGVDFGDYDPETEHIIETTTLSYNISDVLNIDTSWQSAYALSYSFYDKNKGYSEITEGKCGNYYQSIENLTNIITFLSQEDGYMMEYMLNDNEKTGTAAIITDTDINHINTGFQLLSACDPYLPVYTNVTKIADDFVAKRSCVRYKQVQLDANGKEEKIAYIWIDTQYNFASKCELYNAATQELLLRWELKSFTQNVNEEGVKINVNAYNIVTD